MTWGAPEFAWLLVLAIPAAWMLHRTVERKPTDPERLIGVPPPTQRRLASRLAALLSATAALLFVVALCRPQWGQATLQEKGSGVDILIALDVSRSMLADDVPPSRLAAAKRAIEELLPQLQGDRIGLIAFAGSAFLVCPLTTDRESFSTMLAEAGPDTLPLGGTSLSGALTEAGRALDGISGHGRYLIVVSDGEDHAGVAPSSASLRNAGVVVYGATIGTTGGGLIPLPDQDFLRDRKGAIVNSRLQTGPLRSLAAGQLIDLAADPKALAKLYDRELSAGPQGVFARTRQQRTERYQVPLGIALGLLLISALVGARSRP